MRDMILLLKYLNALYMSLGDLRRHKRQVHDEAPEKVWPCGHCEKSYTKEVRLIQHVKAEHRDYLIKITDQLRKDSKKEPIEDSQPIAAD